MESFSSLRKKFESLFPSKRWMFFVLFIILFFVIIGIVSFATISFEKISSSNIFLQKEKIQTPEVPVIHYPSQEITLETPFADTPLVINEPLFPDRICSIIDYGAIADGKTMNTQAFKSAIDACSALGGGKVDVPAGVWLSGPIHLTNNIELYIDRDATILFSADPDDYLPVVFSRFEGIEYYNYSPPIYAKDATNVAVTGLGTINGQGALEWWKIMAHGSSSIRTLYAMGDNAIPVTERVFGTKEQGLRPAFIECIRCHNVLIENIRIVNGPMWTIHPVYSDNVIVRGVDIATDPGPSTDGVAVDSSSNVLIENSTFRTGDDAIVLKSGRDREGMRLHIPTENVIIRNNIIKEAHGAIAIGSEMSGDVRNVFAHDTTINSVQFGFRIKATKGRGGIVENIWVENMQMRSVSIGAIQITTAYGFPFKIDSTALPLFRNIHLKNISAEKTRRTITVDGLPELPVSNVSFENITLYSTRDGAELSNTDTISFRNVNLTFKFDDPLFSITNSTSIDIHTTPCPLRTPICLSIVGDTSSNIDISDSGFSTEERKIVIPKSKENDTSLLTR